MSYTDTELESRARRTTEKVCENLHIIANEPSLALYRISEHVRKALPPTIESRCEVKRLNLQLTGAHYDAEYGLKNIQAMERAVPTFTHIEELLRRSIWVQQQTKHEQPHRRVKREGGSSLYQRFSVHLPSVDIPDLADFKESARETAQRVESVINKDSREASSTNSKSCTRSKSELLCSISTDSNKSQDHKDATIVPEGSTESQSTSDFKQPKATPTLQ